MIRICIAIDIVYILKKCAIEAIAMNFWKMYIAEKETKEYENRIEEEKKKAEATDKIARFTLHYIYFA